MPVKHTKKLAPEPHKQPSKQELKIQRYLKRKRYQRQREDWESRHGVFVFEKHPDVEDPTKDVKRIQRTLELDDMYFPQRSDLEGGVTMMELCAGNRLSAGEAPLDIRFLAALQRVSDYHHGRMLEVEWGVYAPFSTRGNASVEHWMKSTWSETHSARRRGNLKRKKGVSDENENARQENTATCQVSSHRPRR